MKKEVKTVSEPKHTNVFGTEEFLKTDNAENFSENTKEDVRENSKKKLKDISNTDKETYGKTLGTTPRMIIVRTSRKN